jgi:4-hydroxyphenylpyruvate dioxygenase
MDMKTSRSVHRGQYANLPVESREGVKDPLAIEAIDHLEIYSANGRETVFFLSRALGFTPVAYRGPETGYPEAASYVLRQGSITFVVTSPLRSFHPISMQLLRHGPTVHDIALQVASCDLFYAEALRRGAKSVEPPTIFEDESGTVRRAAIATYGDVVHSIVERSGYRGIFWPGFVPYESIFRPYTTKGSGIFFVDHMVGNVELGAMDQWVSFYEEVLGFKEMLHFTDDQISTEYSALMSKVMRDGKNKVKFPLNEPAKGKRKSQIEEYLDFHNGPGVQHIALLTMDIIKTVSQMRDNGVEFLRVPATYYEELTDRVGTIKEDLKTIADLGILVDRDEDGYLLQIFTRPVQDRPTLFFEIIQREGSAGFGIGNFKALFEAIEREQALRGNL